MLDKTFECNPITGDCFCYRGYKQAKDVQYCKINDKYFDLCKGTTQGKCDCYVDDGYVKAMDCQYCDIRNDYFDF